MKKQKGFTLIEILVSVAIGAILLGLVSQFYITGSAKVSTMYKSEVNLQNDVKSSMDMVINTLKDSKSVFFVGDDIYKPSQDPKTLNSDNLDDRFNYIVFYNNGKGTQLVNVVSRGSGKGFDYFPVVASETKDFIYNSPVDYNLKLYKGDKNYMGKFDDKILDITIEGTMERTKGDKPQTYSLSKAVSLKDSKRVDFSEYFGGKVQDNDDRNILNKITAIAYKPRQPVELEENKPEEKSDDEADISLVFMLSNGMSMSESTTGEKPQKYIKYEGKYYVSTDEAVPVTDGSYNAKTEYKFLPKGLTYNQLHYPPYIEYHWKGKEPKSYNIETIIKNAKLKKILAKDSARRFVKEFGQKAKENSLNVGAYIYSYANAPLYSTMSKDGNYLYNIKVLQANKYGPYALQDGDEKDEEKGQRGLALKRIDNGLGMNYDPGTTTLEPANLGEALLQGFELLNQIEGKKVLILLTDANPTSFTWEKRPEVRYNDALIYKAGDYKGGEIQRVGPGTHLTFGNGTYPIEGSDKFTDNKKNIKVIDAEHQGFEYAKTVIEKNLNSKTFDKAYIVGLVKKNDKNDIILKCVKSIFEKQSKKSGSDIVYLQAEDGADLDKVLGDIKDDIVATYAPVADKDKGAFDGPQKKK